MADKTINELLKQLGLSEKESAIYLALLQFGPQNIAEISHKTGIARPLIYKELPKLLQKTLATKTPKGSREYYIAEPPEKLEPLFENLKATFNDSMPELLAMNKYGKNKPSVKFLEGKKGIMSVFEDLVTSLKRGDIYYRYSSVNDLLKMEEYLPKKYKQTLEQKQIERFILTNQVEPQHIRPSLGRDVRVVPAGSKFDFDILQLIYADKVALIDFNSETAFIVRNQKNAEFQKKLFKLLYNSLE